MLPKDPYSNGNEDDPLHDDEDFQELLRDYADGYDSIDGVRKAHEMPEPPLHHRCRCVIVPLGEPLDHIREVARALGHSIKDETGMTITQIILQARIQEAHQREMGEAILDSLGWSE